MKLTRILVPLDFSANSNNALRYAIQFSHYTNSTLVLFHSNHIPYTLPSTEIKKIHEQSEGRKQLMMEYCMNNVCKKHKLKKPKNIIYIVERETNVIANIIKAAHESKSELIIIGTKGASNIKSKLLGSNTSGVIEQSDVPVLVIPQRYKFKKIKNIVYASDLKNIRQEVKQLTPLAETFNSAIEIIYLDYWKKGIEKKSAAKIDEVLERSVYKNVTFVHKKLSINKPMVQYLSNYTRKQKSAILTMFPEQHNFIESILSSSYTKKISHYIKVPLLSFKKANK